MSTHEVKVVRVEAVEPHPNADKLEILNIWGYTQVVEKGLWKPGDLAVYVEPDYVVDVTHPLFTWLAVPGGPPRHRVKVKKLRGVYSQGVMVPAPPGVQEGDNLIESLGISRWEPPVVGVDAGGEAEGAPPGVVAPKYDLEPYLKYYRYLIEGEQVVITEKLHGTNARFVWAADKEGVSRLYCGSRSEWKAPENSNLWWNAVHQNPWIAPFCVLHPQLVVYGEIYGWIQDLRYGASSGQKWLRVFDLWDHVRKQFLRPTEVEALLPDPLQRVPVLYRGPYDHEQIKGLVDGPSTLGFNIREGIVIKPENERLHPRIGRLALKYVSDRYLEKSK